MSDGISYWLVTWMANSSYELKENIKKLVIQLESWNLSNKYATDAEKNTHSMQDGKVTIQF